MKDIIIVGAGCAGLTLAYYLCKAGLPVTVLEREDTVGGLARTFHYNDSWHFDIGPHRFYTANPRVLNFLREVQTSDFLEIARFSSVYFMGKYHQWPLRMQTIPKLPPLIAMRAGIDLLFKPRNIDPNDVSFRSYTLKRYGKTLYDTFFQDYTEKFVGIPASETHMDWAKVGVERATIDPKVDTASLGKIFKLMLMPKPTELHFIYPREKGINNFWQLCAQKIQEMGGRIITNATPTKLESVDGKIVNVVTNQGELPCSHLAWSAPINELIAFLGLPKTNLQYRSHLIFNVMLNTPPRHLYQWCYYGAKELVFSRITNPVTFSPETIPANKGALCLEVSCQEGDEMWRNPEAIKERLIDDMIKVDIIADRSQIEDIRWERVPNAYPIYHLKYREELDQVTKNLSAWSNVGLLGRTGKFWYNNMDHSIENACTYALNVLQEHHCEGPAIDEIIQAIKTPPKDQ